MIGGRSASVGRPSGQSRRWPSLRLAQAIHHLPEVKQPDKTGDGLGTLAEDGQATFGGQRLVELEEMMVLQRA